MSNKDVAVSDVSVAVANPASQQGTYWLALALTLGLGPTRIKKLIEHYGTAEHVFRASLTELEATGMRAVSAQSIATGKSLELALEECAKVAEAGARVISLSDGEYPARLKEIYDPPVILFVKGSVEVLAHSGIAMVGTRHPTPYGSGMAERLSTDLAARGLVIISGLARGIDTASHRGAIVVKGKTVAVLGTGIDVMYPRRTRGSPSRSWPWAERSFPSFRLVRILRRRISRFVIGSSAECPSACWWWKPRSIAARVSLRV